MKKIITREEMEIGYAQSVINDGYERYQAFVKIDTGDTRYTNDEGYEYLGQMSTLREADYEIKSAYARFN